MDESTQAPKLRVVGYIRVSTDRQAEEGGGLDVQRAAIRRWARTHGHRLLDILGDEGVSGAKELTDRPGLADALHLIRTGKADGIVVYRLDRLARDLIIQETVLAEVKHAGGRVFSTAGAEDAFLADDPADPSRRLIRQVLGSVAEYERSMIALRLRAGRDRKHRAGGYAGFGSPRFGERALEGRLVPDEGEAAVLYTRVSATGVWGVATGGGPGAGRGRPPDQAGWTLARQHRGEDRQADGVGGLRNLVPADHRQSPCRPQRGVGVWKQGLRRVAGLRPPNPARTMIDPRPFLDGYFDSMGRLARRLAEHNAQFAKEVAGSVVSVQRAVLEQAKSVTVEVRYELRSPSGLA